MGTPPGSHTQRRTEQPSTKVSNVLSLLSATFLVFDCFIFYFDSPGCTTTEVWSI